MTVSVLNKAVLDFFEVIHQRHSIRAFKEDPVAPEKLQQILQAVNQAPSAGNLQAYEVYLVWDDKHKTALAKAANDQEFLLRAPLVLVFCAHGDRSAAKYEECGRKLYCVQDATIACTFAMLAATALGLSTVWVGAFDEDEVRFIINAPFAHRPVALLPVGYAAEAPQISPRRSLNDLVHRVEP